MTLPDPALPPAVGEHPEQAPTGADRRPGGREVRDLAELVRLPAIVTIPGDAWSGAAAAGWSRGWVMPLASGMLYLGGMAFNDWSDRDLDAVERPERPIPSGRVDPDTALAVALGLLAGGVGVAGIVGGRAGLSVAAPLALAVVAYDQVAKDTAAGPVLMAVCRGLDVALGASGGDRRAAVPAIAAAGAHTLGVTQLSRHEVHGGAGPSARLAIALSGVAAGLAQVRPWQAGRTERGSATGRAVAAGLSTWLARLGAAAAAAAYLAATVSGYRDAVAAPDDPETVQAAVGGGVMANPMLQTALLAGAGAWLPATATTLAGRAAGALRRLVGTGAVT